MKLNKAHIDGDGNLVLQDISASTVNISTISDEIKTFIEDLYTWHQENFIKPNTINIIVLSTVKDKISNNQNFDDFNIEDNFGDIPAEWRPYQNSDTIFNLLKEYNRISGFKIEAYFIDEIEIKDKAFESDLKLDISPETVIIIDGFALSHEKNKKFANIFDNHLIGGCVIPICEKHKPEVKHFISKKQKEVFPDITYFYHNKFSKQFINIELNVPTKEDLFRRLTNIAVKHLGIAEPVAKSSWMSQYDNVGLNNQKPNFQ